MAEYINRKVLCKILENWRNAHADVDDEYGCGLLEDVICEVNAQTVVDVVEVVRCRDCKHCDKGERRLWCMIHDDMYAEEDYFCASGERREVGT